MVKVEGLHDVKLNILLKSGSLDLTFQAILIKHFGQGSPV